MAEAKQTEIGRYGTGTLSVFRNEFGEFILLGGLMLARRSEKTGEWVTLASGWRVTAEGDGAVRVALGNSEGVVVSLP
jgi:hypothetical protein